ncbi:uncharacterized protein LOC104582424, partial [Brachypodium distachyon]|uniref:uncharacterized protein LOC104582424 n=1 Tax=Brachypodium distachyon TaxID=15368 RepID=UPI00052FEFF0
CSFKVPAWNHNVIKGQLLLLKEKVASTGRHITKTVPEKSIDIKTWSFTCLEMVKLQKPMLSEDYLLGKYYVPLFLIFTKVCQLAGKHPQLQFLIGSHDEQKEICHRLNVHVLPLFHFYRGAEGCTSSFSCTILTNHRLKDVLKMHALQPEKVGQGRTRA